MSLGSLSIGEIVREFVGTRVAGNIIKKYAEWEDKMYSLEQIHRMSDEAARKAKRHGKKPLVITQEIKEVIGKSYGPKIPFLGSYVPRGFELEKELFVDSSGFGASDEPAMTYERFLNNLEIGKAYAVTEAGQFQVYVGVYKIKEGGNHAQLGNDEETE